MKKEVWSYRETPHQSDTYQALLGFYTAVTRNDIKILADKTTLFSPSVRKCLVALENQPANTSVEKITNKGSNILLNQIRDKTIRDSIDEEAVYEAKWYTEDQLRRKPSSYVIGIAGRKNLKRLNERLQQLQLQKEVPILF